MFEAEKRLRVLGDRKRAYRLRELGRVLGEDGQKLRSTVRRLLAAKVIARVSRDMYWLNGETVSNIPAIEEIAAALRPGEFNYIGMESAASLWGVISQIPVDRLVVVTTGREGEFATPFGTIEFVHTAATGNEIVANTVPYSGHGLRLASKRYAVEGLKRARRSLHLIDWEDLEDGD